MAYLSSSAKHRKVAGVPTFGRSVNVRSAKLVRVPRRRLLASSASRNTS